MSAPNTIASDTLVEAIARALCVVGDDPQTYWRDYTEEAQAALTAINEAGYVIVPREPPAGAYQAMLPAVMAGAASDIYRSMINSAQAIKARSGETEGLDPQGESAVGNADAPDHIMPPIRDSGPLESEERE